MTDFLNFMNKELSQDDYSLVENLYNNINSYYSHDGLYTLDFAEAIARSIYENRLDTTSILIGLIYPVYQLNQAILNSEFSG